MNQTRRGIGGLALPVLLLTVLLFVAQAESRPSTENESDIASLPPKADNVELHRVKLLDGTMTEDHPIIMYKEDFVNEDYDPTKNQTKGSHRRTYKHLQRRRHHHSHSRLPVEKQQEKILFDVLPEKPIFIGDADDDADVYNFKASSLLEPTKEETLPKYPKKYHSRQRRQTWGYSYAPQQQLQYHPQSGPGRYYLPAEPARNYQRHPARGKVPNYRGPLNIWRKTKPVMPVNINNRDTFPDYEDDNSLFHNSNPADADFSVFNRPRPGNNNSGGGSSSSSNSWQSPPFNGWQSPPVEVSEPQPIWGESTTRRPSGVSIQTTSAPSIATRRPLTTTTQPPRRETVTSAPGGGITTPKVSNCVWAIVNCCTDGSTQIRYSCFEEFGCHGAFWGINPCADNVRDNAIASLTRSFSSGPPSLGK
ncbi:uncharacterized protein LOC117790228 isoform X2 [Drosophila innubila]|nr:uncharacterized protein LOC117790228 isoform X2 [Drosophila innubila]XP_034485468.1 uncharacterized protein LOC117790228 isoform X2 [Drosophila innubila]XP_034485473.1 uncharacterized protein LOC117790228 isoform X2 [Drosophila innubila]